MFSLFCCLCVLFIKWVGLNYTTLVAFCSILILGVFDSCTQDMAVDEKELYEISLGLTTFQVVGSASASTSRFAIQRICLKRKRKCSVVFILKISLKYFSTNCLCTNTLLYSGDIFCSLITAVIDWIVPINSTFRDVYDLSGKRMEEMAYFSKNELC